MNVPASQLIRPADQLTREGVHQALSLVVTDILAAVGDVETSPRGEVSGPMPVWAARLQGAIFAATKYELERSAPSEMTEGWNPTTQPSFLWVAKHLGHQYRDDDLARQCVLFIGLALTENEVRALAPDVFRSELLEWVPSVVKGLQETVPLWLFHPQIAAVVKVVCDLDVYDHRYHHGRFGLFTGWYNQLDKKLQPWLHPTLAPPLASVSGSSGAIKREKSSPSSPSGPPRTIKREHSPAGWPAPASASALPPSPSRLKSEEADDKKDLVVDQKVHIKKEEE